MAQLNTSRPLAFSDDFVKADLVENVQDFEATGIVINLSPRPMVIADTVPTVVPAWKSAILRGGLIASAERVAIINVTRITNIGGLIFGEWEWFGNRLAKFPRTTPLYISRHDVVGEVETDPFVFANNYASERKLDRYDLRLNLWWAPAETDCFIHNEHPFLEIHTQIFGTGRIQHFRERDESTLFREITMAPGYTHDPFALVRGFREWQYPWHRYYSDSDAIWLAIELHPKA
jgi:hypothetical protein